MHWSFKLCIQLPNTAKRLHHRMFSSCAVGVIGEVCSGASVAAAGVANAKKIPVISPASTSPSLSQPDFFFRTVSGCFSCPCLFLHTVRMHICNTDRAQGSTVDLSG